MSSAGIVHRGLEASVSFAQEDRRIGSRHSRGAIAIHRRQILFAVLIKISRHGGIQSGRLAGSRGKRKGWQLTEGGVTLAKKNRNASGSRAGEIGDAIAIEIRRNQRPVRAGQIYGQRLHTAVWQTSQSVSGKLPGELVGNGEIQVPVPVG